MSGLSGEVLSGVHAVPSTQLWTTFEQQVRSWVSRSGAITVCEIGGGRLPLLTPDDAARLGLAYTVLDISQQELDLAPDEFDKVLADIAGASFEVDGRVDLAFSHMVAEHVRHGEAFHRNVYSLLEPGGHALHFFPTMISLPFVVNRLVPDRLASRLLDIFAPRDRTVHEKFPARYSWTRGPTRRQLQRLESVGFEVVEYWAGFGHGYYKRFPVLQAPAERWWEFARRRRWYGVCNYAFVVVRRPSEE